MTRAYLVTVALFALAFSFSYASDPSPLQDFCVALNNSSDSVVFFNGKVCKDPKLAIADDFYFAGLNIAGNTENILGANFTPATIPGDENQQALLKDPLHVPVGPITRARSKKIKEALNGLIQDIWVDSTTGHSKLGPKEDEGVINLIQATDGADHA
uniref:Cupin type-1 domain-containing protein n=1 Tax=Fagus sylvatica TaxID=28930 RepID=A0A2N9H707_FAGSY